MTSTSPLFDLLSDSPGGLLPQTSPLMDLFTDFLGGNRVQTGPLFQTQLGTGDVPQLVYRAADRAHFASTSSTYRIAHLTGINLMTTGRYPLVTAPDGKYVIVRTSAVRCTAAVGVTAPAEAGFGVSGGDLFSIRPLYGLTAADKHFVFASREGGSRIVDGGCTAYFVVEQAATGTSQTADIDVLGYCYG